MDWAAITDDEDEDEGSPQREHSEESNENSKEPAQYNQPQGGQSEPSGTVQQRERSDKPKVPQTEEELKSSMIADINKLNVPKIVINLFGVGTTATLQDIRNFYLPLKIDTVTSYQRKDMFDIEFANKEDAIKIVEKGTGEIAGHKFNMRISNLNYPDRQSDRRDKNPKNYGSKGQPRNNYNKGEQRNYPSNRQGGGFQKEGQYSQGGGYQKEGQYSQGRGYDRDDRNYYQYDNRKNDGGRPYDNRRNEGKYTDKRQDKGDRGQDQRGSWKEKGAPRNDYQGQQQNRPAEKLQVEERKPSEGEIARPRGFYNKQLDHPNETPKQGESQQVQPPKQEQQAQPQKQEEQQVKEPTKQEPQRRDDYYNQKDQKKERDLPERWEKGQQLPDDPKKGGGDREYNNRRDDYNKKEGYQKKDDYRGDYKGGYKGGDKYYDNKQRSNKDYYDSGKAASNQGATSQPEEKKSDTIEKGRGAKKYGNDEATLEQDKVLQLGDRQSSFKSTGSGKGYSSHGKDDYNKGRYNYQGDRQQDYSGKSTYSNKRVEDWGYDTGHGKGGGDYHGDYQESYGGGRTPKGYGSHDTRYEKRGSKTYEKEAYPVYEKKKETTQEAKKEPRTIETSNTAQKDTKSGAPESSKKTTPKTGSKHTANPFTFLQ